jgi:hypothetical protein
MQEVIVPSHRTIEALRLQRANPFVDEVESRGQRELVVRLDSSIFGAAEDADLTVCCRQVRVLQYAWSGFTRRGRGRSA